MNLTISELSKKTGLSTYEIRRRVHSGTLPHMRVGAKQTKILINEDTFKQMLANESIYNMKFGYKNLHSDSSSTVNIGYDRIRKIN